ncbi:methyltransferase [Fundidesulfovibrio butyratiphilus]
MNGSPVFTALLADPTASLDSLLAAAGARHPVVFETVRLADMEIDVLQIEDMAAYVDRLAASSDNDHPLSLPFWAKLWPASLPMAVLLAKMRPAPASLLEVGAGVGLCGLAAAMRGVRTVITDIEPEAALFIKAAILKNGLADRATAQVTDFTVDRLGQRFETVAASEALYLPHTHAGLLDFLDAHLEDTPNAQVLLSCDDSRRPDAFMSLAKPRFSIGRMETSRTDEDGVERRSAIYRLRKSA